MTDPAQSPLLKARVRAPELRGRGWLNTDGLTLSDLRGKIVLLDFWTFCCINCLHVLDELRPLEERFADVLVTIGVHSPKFEHEKDAAALAAAVERYGVDHPVLDDPEMDMWQQYAAKAWPTLTVIDPEGYVVATMAGEGHAEGLARLVEELVRVHEARGTLRRGDAPHSAPKADDATVLRFPGKALALPDGHFLVADSTHQSLVELDADNETLIRRIGTGQRGRKDGTEPEFSEPGGLCLLPPHVAEVAGYDVVVADTVNHLLRGLKLATGEVTTVAGSGRQWRGSVDFDAHDSLAVDLSSPWDVAWYDDRVVIAMAGIHQLWWFNPVQRTAGVYAGTTVEALRDGPLREVWMAQPSGLSVTADGARLWIADSESSAIRWIEDGRMSTAAGQGLFDFGHVDGPADQALLQHPLGLLALPDGSVLVADTYNGAVRKLADGVVTTVAEGLKEPSDLVLTATGDIVVVESGAHRLVRLAPGTLAAAGVDVAGVRHRTERPSTMLAPGEVELDLIFEPAPGQKLDESFGPSTRLEVSASPPELLLEGAGVTQSLRRRLVLSPDVTEGVLQVVAQAATCDIDAEFPACHLTRQDWGVPVRVAGDGATRLPLVLRGLDQAT
ncbi:NHL domain-containing thioredoxin family protein [Dactylosporangium aurantiacum]|uniref:NHL domain-containing thioredoxin family protein n=1 Tax=Dactylosporangium aurantiacum TaxID=35754 RepID=A0A9Q9IJ08_9ACTN|nr:NHL domain-containing thioredoxin family protein [Dactylosporangium aurantiacum]MDG6101155.1 NHL domain-containing thioredoxin family protein [Dactylosporangium aurantiacum]UWZ54817.1 NHL domain-containing thioredoxin family protein [Dactylosporangium aurantiacum]